jgi:type IV pilus assembly protein PilW
MAKRTFSLDCCLLHIGRSSAGFSMIELIIAMAISTVVIGAVYVLFSVQEDHYTAQSQVVEMQQNLRAGTSMMESDFRMVGYDPEGTGPATFALLDITKRDLDYNLDTNGNSSMQFSTDLDEDGVLDNPDEIITYSLADYPDNTAADQDGVADLTRSIETPVVAVAPGNNRELVAENIESLGIAYAFDANGDGELDTSDGGNVIWGIDTDNDNVLDRGLDTNDDGVIDANDTAGGLAITGAPFSIGTTLTIPYIRAARVWALARAGNSDPNFNNVSTYVVADRQITVADNFRRRLLEFTIYFRNTGL